MTTRKGKKLSRYRRSSTFVSKARMGKLLLELEWSAEAEAQAGTVEAACPVCHGGKPGGTAFEEGWYGHTPSCELGQVCDGVRAMTALKR